MSDAFSQLTLEEEIEWPRSVVSALVFDGPEITVSAFDERVVLPVRLREEYFIHEIQTAPAEYVRLRCPVIMVDAEELQGVIRPFYTTHSLHPVLHSGRHEFHFLFRHEERRYVGRDVLLEESVLHAGMIREDQLPDAAYPSFSVSLPWPQKCLPVDFERG